jgi:ribonuclease HI
MTTPQVTIYTDGSSRGNPGPGGYGVILLAGAHRKELSQGYKSTTNNRMELLAVITGLKALKKKGIEVTIYSDSQYVINSVQKGWLRNWIRTNFAGGKKNRDLWMEYHRTAQDFQVQFVWVKGHAENALNNRCDQLATTAADNGPWLVDEGFVNESKNLLSS